MREIHMASVDVRVMTSGELAEIEDDGQRRYELLRGELLEMGPTGDEHGAIQFELARRLGNYIVEHQLGRGYGAETGFLLARDPDTVLAPDITFVRADRLPAERQGPYLALAPDLVVEIVSPSDRLSRVNDKMLTYLDAGVRLVWIVDPQRQIVTTYAADGTVRVLRDADELDGGDVLPGFRLPVADIFA
jgi:Uma2 family endonuclease